MRNTQWVTMINNKRKSKIYENVLPRVFKFLDVLHIVLLFIRKRTLIFFCGISVFFTEINREQVFCPIQKHVNMEKVTVSASKITIYIYLYVNIDVCTTDICCPNSSSWYQHEARMFQSSAAFVNQCIDGV